jgi:CMP-N,N'-diacetyllegionaminic acid synthase
MNMDLLNEIDIDDDRAIGLIPARGGSKSIPLKNLAMMAGRPLISYVMAAGLEAATLSRVYCSTDNADIARFCRDGRVEVLERPNELGGDDVPVVAVVRHVLEMLAQREGRIPGLVALLQPTSPFILASHIDGCVLALREQSTADSAQTITPVIHNAHAFNQRILVDGLVQFRFPHERAAAYNKQRKPRHHVFGNLVVMRSRAILSGKDCFGVLSIPLEIPQVYSLDVDTAEDLDYANYLVSSGKVLLSGLTGISHSC